MPAIHIGLVHSLSFTGAVRPRSVMQEEGWLGEWRRDSAVILFMSSTPIGLILLFVAAPVHIMSGTGSFHQLRRRNWLSRG